MTQVTTISEARCFDGTQGFYSHESKVCNGTMRFAVHQPPQALAGQSVPVVTYLPCLTCTEENFVIKAGAQRMASELVRKRPSRAKILIDQGTADDFLEEQLKPELLVEACEAAGQHFELRMQPGYDHSYYFIQSFVADHLRHHAEALKG